MPQGLAASADSFANKRATLTNATSVSMVGIA
jgi:hypothetical protein